jgi:high-affinity iron transporter
MAAAFVIAVREGVEAFMIVAILLAYLDRLGRRDLFRDIFIGVGLALTLAGVAGVVIYTAVGNYGGRGQTIFETITYLLAAAVLTYMTFWMRNHGRSIRTELGEKIEAAIDGRARMSLSFIAFQAVGRESVETTVFLLAIAFGASTRSLLIGAAAGLLVALGMSIAMFKLGHRINLGRFFTVVGVLLMVFAAGLLVDAIQNMQELGWLPVLTKPLWNTSGAISDSSALGDILHTFFGYAQSPTVLQAVVYVGYVAIALIAYFGLINRSRPHSHA